MDLLNNAPNRLTSPPQQSRSSTASGLDPSKQLLALLGGGGGTSGGNEVTNGIASASSPIQSFGQSYSTMGSGIAQSQPQPSQQPIAPTPATSIPSVSIDPASDPIEIQNQVKPVGVTGSSKEEEDDSDSGDSVIILEERSTPIPKKQLPTPSNHLDSPVTFSDSRRGSNEPIIKEEEGKKPILSALHHLSSMFNNSTSETSGFKKEALSDDQMLITLDLRVSNPGGLSLYPAKLEIRDITAISSGSSNGPLFPATFSSDGGRAKDTDLCFPSQKVETLGMESQITIYVMSKGRIRIINLENGNRELLLVPGRKEIRSLVVRSLTSGGYLIVGLIGKNLHATDQEGEDSLLIWKIPEDFGESKEENVKVRDHTKPIGGINSRTFDEESNVFESRFLSILTHPKNEREMFLSRNDGKVLKVGIEDCIDRNGGLVDERGLMKGDEKERDLFGDDEVCTQWKETR